MYVCVCVCANDYCVNFTGVLVWLKLSGALDKLLLYINWFYVCVPTFWLMFKTFLLQLYMDVAYDKFLQALTVHIICMCVCLFVYVRAVDLMVVWFLTFQGSPVHLRSKSDTATTANNNNTPLVSPYKSNISLFGQPPHHSIINSRVSHRVTSLVSLTVNQLSSVNKIIWRMSTMIWLSLLIFLIQSNQS